MANIADADYELMAKVAKDMRERAVELNTELKNVYTKVEEMHNSWYGARYNELVKIFNEMEPQLNELLKLIVTDIPFSMETIANTYSNADRFQNVTSAEETNANLISALPITNDVGMRFVSGDVNNAQRTISEGFNKTKDLMSKVRAQLDNVSWRSEAADTYRSKMKELEDKINSAFDNINTQFVRLMNQTQQDIENAEKSNTVQ